MTTLEAVALAAVLLGALALGVWLQDRRDLRR